jgi:hypothetical protein
VSTVEDAVDKFRVIELCRRPHWIFDHEHWTELAEVFTDPLSMPTLAQAGEPGFDPDRYLDGYLVDRAELVRGMQLFKRGVLTQHLVAGHHVELAGDTAVCRAHSINIHYPVGDVRAETLLAHGNDYRFDCVRTAAGWRIRGWVPAVRWSHGNDASHDAAAKQRAWLESAK